MSHDARSRNGGGGMPPASTSSRAMAAPRGVSSPSGRSTSDESSNSGPITLSVPRPEHQRSTNVYVDTPFQHKVQPRRPPSTLALIQRPPQDLPLVHGAPGRFSFQRQTHKKAATTPNDTSTLQKQKSRANVILSQPTTFTKDLPEEDSIICGRCGRCRCEACTTPRKTGGFWLCGGKCLCSPTTAVDILSCLCCIRGMFYHYWKDADEEAAAVDRPCSCNGPNTVIRWVCLAATCIPLPCLVCYWPLEGVRRLCEGTYRRFSTQGCRCDHARSPEIPRRLQPPPPPPEKRLLQDCV